MSSKNPRTSAAFAESIFRDYGRQLHRFLMRRLQHAQDADDLVQQVYVELIRTEHAELVRNPRGYALRIAANVASDFLRNAGTMRSHLAFDSNQIEQLSEQPYHVEPDEMAAQVLDARRLRRAFDRLPPLHQAAFLLQARDGYTYEETAQRLEVSVRRVERLLAEARELLQTLLRQD